MTDRPNYLSEEEWREFLEEQEQARAQANLKPERRKKKAASPNGKYASNRDLNFFRDADGRIVKSWHENIRIALHGLEITLRQNDFTGAPQLYGLPGEIGELTDEKARRVWYLISENYNFHPQKQLFEEVLSDMAHLSRFHPVREWLDSIEWDGNPRIDNWLVAYGGAEDIAFNRAVGRVFLIAGVRRVRRPGCKFDTLLVLEGPQGKNKSQAAEVLATRQEWFTDGLSLDADTKDVIEQTKGSWIIEFAELTGMHSRNIEHIKTFLSRKADKARPAYGRRVQTVQRQFIGIGTTNDSEYMRKDERRLWPVLINWFDLDALRRDVAQLWAEAAHYEAEGEDITLPEDLWQEASEARKERIIANPLQEALASAIHEGPGWLGQFENWDIAGIPIERRAQKAKEMGQAMRALGFKPRQIGASDDERGRRGQRFYERGEKLEPGYRNLRW